jgi:hypothetical protein
MEMLVAGQPAFVNYFRPLILILLEKALSFLYFGGSAFFSCLSTELNSAYEEIIIRVCSHAPGCDLLCPGKRIVA